jgi:hypothetical protein
MACYHPLLAYKTVEGKITFNALVIFSKGFNLPCGQCTGCRLEYSRQWAIRNVHEAQMHEKSSFITLTFNNESLNARETPSSLNVRDFQLFMKKLRKKHKNIRFFHCGEYGSKNKRPHYHALIFGHDFPDKKLHTVENGFKLYKSHELQELWPYGFNLIGDITFKSAAYVSRYIMKKQKGKDSQKHYETTDENGVVTTKKPEYCTMSRKPGIGANWFKKYIKDVYPHDYIIINGLKVRPPRYYDNLLAGTDKDNPSQEYLDLKERRKEQMPDVIENYDENLDRLFVQEEVKIKQLERLFREL